MQNAKNYLKQAEQAKQRLIQCETELSDLHSDKYLTEIEKLRIAKNSWLNKRKEIKNFIHSLPCEEYLKTILIMHYISNKNFITIAEKLNYSYRYVVRKLHPKALLIAEKALQEGTQGDIKS